MLSPGFCAGCRCEASRSRNSFLFSSRKRNQKPLQPFCRRFVVTFVGRNKMSNEKCSTMENLIFTSLEQSMGCKSWGEEQSTRRNSHEDWSHLHPVSFEEWKQNCWSNEQELRLSPTAASKPAIGEQTELHDSGNDLSIFQDIISAHRKSVQPEPCKPTRSKQQPQILMLLLSKFIACLCLQAQTWILRNLSA